MRSQDAAQNYGSVEILFSNVTCLHADQKQIVVEPIASANNSKGSRNQSNLNSIFSSSPIYNELSDQERLDTFLALTKGEILNGNGISFFDTRFVGNTKNPVPNLNDVVTGGGGLPSSPYTPNPSSPGPGSTSALDQPAYEGDLKDPATINNFGTGLGGLVEPSTTAKNISAQKIGDYVSGRSYQGSDGNS